MKSWRADAHWPPPFFSRIPFSWNLRLNSFLFKEISQRVSIISFICRQPSHVLARSSRLSGLYGNGLNQLADMLPFIFIGRSGTSRQRHSFSINKEVNQNAFSFISMRNTRSASFSAGKKSRRPLLISSRSAPYSALIQEAARCNCLSLPSECHAFSQRQLALFDAHCPPRGRSHQRQPVTKMNSSEFKTLRG